MSVCAGENWTVQHINAIMHSEYWKSTAIIVVWDDFGGFYDHVPRRTTTCSASARAFPRW